MYDNTQMDMNLKSTLKSALLILLTSWLWMPSVQAQQTLVTVDPVVRQDYNHTIPILGRLVTVQAGTVAAQVAGAVAQINVKVGDRLDLGQSIAAIDDQPIRLRKELLIQQRKEVEARIAVVEAQLELARQDVERLSSLTQSSAVSQSQIDNAIQQQNIVFARVQEAKAALSIADAQIRLVDRDLNHVEIKSPYVGTVIEKLTEVGSYLQQGSGVIKLTAYGDFELEADVPVEHLEGLTTGRKVKISFNGSDQFHANVRTIIPEENPRTRTRRVRFTLDIDASFPVLAVAQSVTVQIPAGADREINSVHKDAIIHQGKGSIVYVVEEGFAKLRPVELGSPVGDRLEVVDGLSEGDLAVIRGNERLRPNQPVQMMENPS